MADELISAGADVNCRTILGWTPIHMVAMQGQKEAAELAKILVGADLAAVN
jgi:ankyrin repeat protein